MNANSISRPISQQSAHSWTPLLAAVLLAIALIVGVASVAALTAKTSNTSPAFVPQSVNSRINGVPNAVTTPVFVPQSVNSHETSGFRSLQGVPYPGGVAGPSQLHRLHAPGMGGH